MSRRRLVVVPNPKSLIKESPGFAKKDLSDFKLDIIALCEFGCRYCSSNMGNYLRINQGRFADLTEEQLGERVLPSEDPYLMFEYTEVVEQLRKELARKPKSFGDGKTLVFSMLTDGFSPSTVQQGVTREILDLLVSNTSFRVRILTKNAVVGRSDWIEYFLRHRDRFVVGLSTGTFDSEWSKAIEVGTSAPKSRLQALRALQDAGVHTYGMMCPIFPDVILNGALDELIDAIRPERCQTIWAEPYNDRQNWEKVRAGYSVGSKGWNWFTDVYGIFGDPTKWSKYATELFVQLQLRAEKEGWLPKLKYLLYEHGIASDHARSYCDPRGLLLQSPGDKDGYSGNPHIRKVQEQIGGVSAWDRLMQC